MPRTSNLKPAFRAERNEKGLAAWVLNVPAELSPTGKRQQLFFPTKTEAQTNCEKLKARKDNFGISLTAMTPARIAAAAEAFKLLDTHGIDLLDAVRSHLASFKEKTASITFGAAFDRFFELKEKKSAKYRQEIRQTRATFTPLLDRPVCDISAAELEPILDRLPDASRNAKMRRLRSVFNLAAKRGWMLPGTSPITRLDFADTPAKEVEIYSPAEVTRLMETALEDDLELVPFLTLAFFCGIRPDGELQKLQWNDLKFDGEKPQVVIRPEVSKIKRRRFVDLSANALAWLETYRELGGPMTGKIVPFSASTLRRKRRRNRIEAKVARVIQQGARHSFCSYWLAKHKDANALILQSGHKDADTMWRNYHRGTPETEAKKFWSIIPPKEETNIIRLSA